MSVTTPETDVDEYGEAAGSEPDQDVFDQAPQAPSLPVESQGPWNRPHQRYAYR